MNAAGSVAVGVSLLLAGCSGLQPRHLPPGTLAGSDSIAAATAEHEARAAKLGLANGACDVPAWQMTGRAALSNGKQGGSGRIEWRQGGQRSEVTLSAPVTRQSWRLVVDAAGAQLDGVENGPMRGPDANLLLRDATGWEIPVKALGCWLRGVPGNANALGESRIKFGTDRLPAGIEQAGWTIDYAGWALEATSGAMLPSRVNAQRGDSRVRLIVDRWDAE